MNWKEKFVYEYTRTTGRTDICLMAVGSWYRISTKVDSPTHNDVWSAISSAYRKSDILEMTKNLESRPSLVSLM